MDIKSMVNSEDTPAPRKYSASTPVKPEYRPSPPKASTVYENQAPAHDGRRDIRPPQPSPLQTQGQNDFHLRNGSMYNTAQSPYQQTSPPSFRGGHGPPQILNQSPGHGHQTPHYAQRESYPTSGHPNNRPFGHSTPVSQTPTASTPGSASGFANFQRPSSSHSATTPVSAQYSSSVLRESPQPAHHQMRTSSQPQNGQQYMSQPSTPLGPPLTYARSNLHINRGSPGSYDHQRTLSGSSHGQTQVTTPSSAAAKSPQNYRVQHSRSSIPGHTSSQDREGSESVSPKTRLPSLPRIDSMDTSSDQAHQGYGTQIPAKRRIEWDTPGSHNAPSQTNRTTSLVTSIGVNGLLNAGPSNATTQRLSAEQTSHSPSKIGSEIEAKYCSKMPSSQTKPMYQPHLDTNISTVPPTTIPRKNSIQPNTSLHQISSFIAPSTMTTKSLSEEIEIVPPPIKSEGIMARQTFSDPQPQPIDDIAHTKIDANKESHQPMKVGSSENGKSNSSQPVRKKLRLQEPSSEQMLSPPSSASTVKVTNKTSRIPRITSFRDVPIYAQSIRGRERTEELFLLSQRRTATGQSAPLASHVPVDDLSLRSAQVNGNRRTNGHDASTINGRAPVVQPAAADLGPLGHWEKSILGIEPMEELTKTVGDFLYQEVMARTDIGVGPAGGAANLGAIFEIEAKIGQLIDQNTNDRLRLPVLNECVINHASPDLRVKFQSSMTEVQHRNFNQFLNKALVESQPPKPGQPPPPAPRVPMSYKHTYETDTFYDLSQAGILQLPPSLASTIHNDRRSKAKVRITTEQKGGNVIAKIIKARIADIEVYSPKTPFDWRVSVSVEMDYQGDMKQLVEPDRRDGKRADRNKDRMSYKHQGYQIDLTQVTPAEATSKTEKEHELEVEVSSAEVRRQGQLLQSGQRNDYGKLIRSFVDNVRVLARVCPL